jgi:O-antigen ligase
MATTKKSFRRWARRLTLTESERKLCSAKVGALLLYGTFGLLLFGPLAFGAVEPWSIFVLEIGSVVLALFWLFKQWLDSEIVVRSNPLFLPMGVFALLIAIQIVFRASAYPHDTISGAMLFCAYAMLCFLSTQTLLRGAQARQLAWIFIVYGCAVAAFAMLQGISPNGKLYWVRTPRLGGWVYGPYVNHNHYAGLMELLVPIPLVVSLSRLAEEKERIAAGIVAAIMVGTIFLSGSRGGMLAIFVEMIVFAIVLLRQRKGVRIALTLVAFAVVLISMLSWLGGKELTARVSSISSETRSEVSGGMRLSIDRDTWHMFRNKPVLGWGLGTFPTVYPQFRTFYTNFFVNEAHNDYLQLLAEMGLLGFATMLWFVVIVYRKALPKLGNWTSDVNGATALVCTLAFTGILVHSFFDFNLQIPANAALFFVASTIAAAPALIQKSRKRKPTPAAAEELASAPEVV